MKKIFLIFFPCILFLIFTTSCNHSKPSPKSTNHLTLKQAYRIALTSAKQWDKRIRLSHATSIDDNGKATSGKDGTRENWNLIFIVPNTYKTLLVTIHGRKIISRKNFTTKGTAITKASDLVQHPSEIRYDSPELVKKAIKMKKIDPSKGWANGYHFGLFQYSKKKIPIVSVTGWNKKHNGLTKLYFNAKTGAYMPTN